MPEFHASVTIDRPPAAVFAYVADIARWPEWRMAVNNAELVTPGPVGVGTRITVAGSAMGRSMEIDGVGRLRAMPGREEHALSNVATIAPSHSE